MWKLPKECGDERNIEGFHELHLPEAASGTNWDSQNANLDMAFLNMIRLVTTQINF